MIKNNGDSTLVDISNSKPSSFNFLIGLLNYVNGSIVFTNPTEIKLIPLTGQLTQIRGGSFKCDLEKTNFCFEFKLKMIPQNSCLLSLELLTIKGEINESCSVYTILNSFKNYNLNHEFYFNLIGSGSNTFLFENDKFIWVK